MLLPNQSLEETKTGKKKRKKSQFLGQYSANWTNVHADYQKCHELLVYVVHLFVGT